jgi:tetratricopeptide (TPR) repeat protein
MPWAALIIALSLLIYFPAFSFPFVNYDDPGYITGQARVLRGLSAENLRWAFTTLQFSNWHPLTWISYLTDISLFGPSPHAMHAENILLHVLNGLLLLWLLWTMTGSAVRSGLVALLFIAHPLRLESVAWISERKDLLSALFGLLAIAAYVSYARRTRKGAYAAMALLYAASLMSKPMLVTLPALLLLLDLWPLRRLQRQEAIWPSLRPLILEKLPLLAMSLAVAAIAYYAQAIGGALGSSEKFPLVLRLQNAAASYWSYLHNTFWPSGLTVFYPYPKRVAALEAAAGLLTLTGITGAAGWLAWSSRRWSGPAVGWLWFAGTLVPVIGIVQIGLQSRADRYTYFPSIGLCIAVVWSAAELLNSERGRKFSPVAVAVALALVGGLTWQARKQVSYWQSSEQLWTRALEVTRDNFIAHGSLGQRLLELNRGAEALPHLREAVRLYPGYGEAYGNIGLLEARAGHLAEAEAAYVQAARLAPDKAVAYLNLGVLYAGTNRPQQAEQAYLQALSLNPDSPDAYFNLGLLYAGAGRPEEAVAIYREGISHAADNLDLRRNLALLLTQLGSPAEAVEQYLNWIRLEPQSAQAHNNLANALVRLGRPQQAVEHYQQAIRLDAGYLEPLLNLGIVQTGLQNQAAAVEAFQAALRIDPANAVATARLRSLQQTAAPPR